MKTLLKNSAHKGISYEAYTQTIQKLVREGKTSGTEQTTERISFTKLNASRMRRLNKTFSLSAEQTYFFKETSKQTWLILTESWCGDAAQTIPVLNKIAETTSSITLKLLFRDDNLDLMNAFLTNGSQAIPKLIVIDKFYNVLYTWGSRSKKATKLVENYKREYGKIDDEFKRSLQIWYNQDKGESIIADLMELTNENNFVL